MPDNWENVEVDLEGKDPNEPMPRGEYEKRHKLLQQRYENFAGKSTRILLAICLIVFLTAVGTIYLFNENSKRVDDNASFAHALSASIVNTCKTSSNPFRRAVRIFGHTLIDQETRQLTQNEVLAKTHVYDELFPSFDPVRREELLARQRKEGLKTIKGLKKALLKVPPVPCEKKYPPPVRGG